MGDRWLYLYDGKLRGGGIDLVAEQQLRALAEGGLACDLVARGRLDLPGLRNRTWPFPPSKLLSWLPSQDYYAANKRFFSWLGRWYFSPEQHAGVIAWSKSALKPFEAAARSGAARLLNVGNFHCDFEAGGQSAPARWPRIEKARLRAEYELATTIMVASDYAASTFVAQGVPAAKLAVLYRGVDLERFQPAQQRSETPFIVASCGSQGERKGTQQLLRAWRQAALPDAELWLIGNVPGHEQETLANLAGPNVRFLGFRRDLPALLAQAHVHVLLSRHEGFAKVLLEAAACGVANVCTAATGWPQGAPGAVLIDDRGDADAVATVLRRLHDERQDCIALGRAARAWVEQGYSWAHFRARVRRAVSAAGGAA